MITDDERREVARRLRKNVGKGMQLILNVAFSAFEFTGCSERTVNADEAALRLADLIDPDNIPDNAAVTGRPLSEPEIDRERLLAIATVMAADSVRAVKQGSSVSPVYILHAARNIAEACGETFGSIRNRELAEWGTSIVPKETIVDRDALLKLADEMKQAGKEYRYQANENAVYSDLIDDAPEEFIEYARRIREALGVES